MPSQFIPFLNSYQVQVDNFPSPPRNEIFNYLHIYSPRIHSSCSHAHHTLRVLAREPVPAMLPCTCQLTLRPGINLGNQLTQSNQLEPRRAPHHRLPTKTMTRRVECTAVRLAIRAADCLCWGDGFGVCGYFNYKFDNNLKLRTHLTCFFYYSLRSRVLILRFLFSKTVWQLYD